MGKKLNGQSPISSVVDQMICPIIIVSIILFLIFYVIAENKYYIIDPNNLTLASILFMISALASLFYQIYIHVYFINLKLYEGINMFKGNFQLPRRILFRLYPLIACILVFTTISIIENHILHICISVIYLLIFPTLDFLVLFSIPNDSNNRLPKIHEEFKKIAKKLFIKEDGPYLAVIIIINTILYFVLRHPELSNLRGFVKLKTDEVYIFSVAITFLLHTLFSVINFITDHRNLTQKIKLLWES